MGGQRDIDQRIRDLAARQHGVVARRQLIDLGLSSGAIEARLRAGRLIRLHRGVYAVGHAELRRQGFWLAAALALGPSAVVSHATGLALWDLRPTTAAWVDVTVPTGAGIRRRRGIRVFRHADLQPNEVTLRDGVPVTTVPRTLLDAATILESYVLRRAAEAAFRKHRVTVAAMRRLLEAHPGRAGTAPLRLLVDDFEAYGVTFTRSNLESMMLQLCLERDIPRPQINRRNGGREIDCRWPDHGLVVELDGYETHQGRVQFVADRARNRAHVLRGETIVAYTAYDLRDRRDVVADEILSLLERLAA